MPSCLSIVASCFYIFFSLFVTFCYFRSACNFHKSFFTVDKGQGYYFIIFTSLFKGSGCALIFFLFFLLLKGRGVEVNVFFPPSFNMWKGVNCFILIFFIVEWLGIGGQGFLF